MALAAAPIAAFVGGMEVVSKVGIAGVALIVASAAWRLSTPDGGADANGESGDAQGDDRASRPPDSDDRR